MEMKNPWCKGVSIVKTYTFSKGKLTEGIDTQKNELFGQVIFLGEEGKGRRYETVSMDRHSPATVKDSKVYEALPRKITLPSRDGRPEKSFYVLARQDQATESVLVRVNTEWVYTKNTQGYWKTIEGQPETLVAGYGAHGLAGNVGNWRDGLITMKPGDVLAIFPEGGYKTDTSVLYFSEGKLTTGNFENWKAGRSAEKVSQGTASIEILFGMMPVYTFGNSSGKWALTEGIETNNVPGGRAVILGPRSDFWRAKSHKVLGVINELSESCTPAAIAKVGQEYTLVNSDRVEDRKFMVRTDTDGLRKLGRTAAVTYRGNPQRITFGYMVHGTENVTAHYDELWVVSEGDVLRIGQDTEEQYKYDFVIYVENGQLLMEKFYKWLVNDAKQNPQLHHEKGWTLVENVPPSWIGKAVEKRTVQREYDGFTFWLVEKVNPLKLSCGWNDNPPTYWTSAIDESTVWLKLLNISPEEQWVQTGQEIVTRLCEPLIPNNERRVATIETIGSDWAWRGGPQVWVYKMTFEADARRVKLTHFEKGGQKDTKEEVLEEIRVEHTYVLKDANLISGRHGEIYGRLLIHRESTKRNLNVWMIHDENVDQKEFEQIQGQVEKLENEAIRLRDFIFSQPQTQKKGIFDTAFKTAQDQYLVDVRTKSIYINGIGRGHEVDLKELVKSGLLQTWANALDNTQEVKTWAFKTVSDEKSLKAFESPESKMEFMIEMGQNRGREESTIWILDSEGDCIDTRSGAGAQAFTNVPESSLVLRHMWSNYGYTKTEIFEVWYLPKEVTDAQKLAAVKIAIEFERVYFQGKNLTWDISKKGQRVFKTQYKASFVESFPVDTDNGKYSLKKLQKTRDTWEDADHPINLIVEVSLK